MPYVNGKLRTVTTATFIEFWEAVNNEPRLHTTWTDSSGNYALYMGASTKYHAVVNGCYAPPILDVTTLPLTVNLTLGSTPFPLVDDRRGRPHPEKPDFDRIVFYRMKAGHEGKHGLKKLLRKHPCLVWRDGGCEMSMPDDADDLTYDLVQAEVAAFLKANETPMDVAGFERYEIDD